MIAFAAMFGLAGILLIGIVMQDAFEVVLLPRSVQRRIRLMTYYFKSTWVIWSGIGARLDLGPKREAFLSVYGPLSMVLLFSIWAINIILGYALIMRGFSEFRLSIARPDLLTCLMTSGEAFFTLGSTDAGPQSTIARICTIAEAGTGFGFIAATISYLPVLHQHFFQRDVKVIQMAPRAGSPPTAMRLLLWHAVAGDDLKTLEDWLSSWEVWAADLIESHSSYPMLAFYRSQHRSQSWLASLAVILDVCTLLMAGVEGSQQQREITFLACRRVLEEMCHSLNLSTRSIGSHRFITIADGAQIDRLLAASGARWTSGPSTWDVVDELRLTYEAMLSQLSDYLLLPLPDWIGHGLSIDDYSRSQVAALRRLSADPSAQKHWR